jgi:hypothetical protein
VGFSSRNVLDARTPAKEIHRLLDISNAVEEAAKKKNVNKFFRAAFHFYKSQIKSCFGYQEEQVEAGQHHETAEPILFFTRTGGTSVCPLKRTTHFFWF